MWNCCPKPITLKDLCQNLYAGSRTISCGFEEVFGVSPIAYLKILRLEGVRQALKKADPSQTTVLEIANRFGFWSAGHFTRDYKNFFGELPSVTLGKNSLQ
ncbi:MAG: helix-turn-helix domain-containing protein [Snowella sp.]|nr:helix-turn-helix domain-containing protein [Snowella sp.]